MVPGDNDNGDSRVEFGEMRLHSEPVHLRHVQIEDDAIRRACVDGFQERRTGVECLRIQAGGTHQPRQGFTDGFFVINERNKWPSFGHDRPRVAGRGRW